MGKTVVAILVALVVIVSTIAATLAMLFFAVMGGIFLWSWLVKKTNPLADGGKSAPPYRLRTRKAHPDAAVALGVTCGGDDTIVVSAGREGSLVFYDTQYGTTETVTPGFPAGALATGYHDDNGTRVALGRFPSINDEEPGDVGIAIWEQCGDLSVPYRVVAVSDFERVVALAFDDTADRLLALMAVSEDGAMAPWRFQVRAYDLRDPEMVPAVYESPEWLPNRDITGKAAFSADGTFIALRTERLGSDGVLYHGVGVWDLARNRWRHRLGGLETQPHRIYAVTRTGDRVFTAREDDPGRDYRNGGQEWYDGLYIWDVATAKPEGETAAKPEAVYTDSSMVFDAAETRFAASAPGGAVCLYDTDTRQIRRRFVRPAPDNPSNANGNSVWCMAFRPDGAALLVGYADGEIWDWDTTPEPAETSPGGIAG